MIKAIFSVILFVCIGCHDKEFTNSKVNKIKVPIKNTLLKNKVADTIYQNQQFDSLLVKFYYKNIKEFSFKEEDKVWYDDKYKFYKLTYKDFNTLNLHDLYVRLGQNKTGLKYTENDYWNNLYCYSIHERGDNFIGATIMVIGDGNFSLYYLIYKDRKLVSFGNHPFAVYAGSIRYYRDCKTQQLNQDSFYTVDKGFSYENNILYSNLETHNEILTTVNKNSIVSQNVKVFMP